VKHLRRYAHSPKGDHDGHTRRISVYFNSTQTVGPSRHTWRPWSCPGLGSGSWSRRTRGGPGAAPGRAAGAGAAGHVATLELPRAEQRELEPQDMWRPRSCPGPGSGSWSHRTRGDPGAAPGWAAGAEAAGHAATPELPRAVRFMLRLITCGST
jgi:hypothetical protein